MRSLFAKTLLWFLATTAVAIAGIIITTAATFSSTEGRGPLGLLLSVQTEEAKRAYETGGREALAAALAKIPANHAISGGVHGCQGYRSADRQSPSGADEPAEAAQPLAPSLSRSEAGRRSSRGRIPRSSTGSF